MQEATENLAIKIFLDNNTITQEDYDILFSSKEAWYVLNVEGKQDWSLSDEQQIAFWESIKKIKNLFENMPQIFHTPAIYDFSFIQFPKVHINNSCIVSPNELLSEFSDSCLFAIFYKAVFYGEVNIVNSQFKIDLDFRECIFKDQFWLVKCTIKGINFSNTIFEQKTNIKKSIFKNGTKFNNATFHDDIILEELYFEDHVNLTITSMKKSIFNDLTFEKIASFGGAIFVNSVAFNTCNFNGSTDFTKTGFNEQVFFSNVFFHDVKFIEVIFLSNATFIFLKADYFIMRKPIITKLKINNSFIKDSDIDRLFSISKNKHKKEPVSLSKKHISDRQTARFIKNLYDNQKNIPNSNQLFAIEQEYFIDEIKNKNILESSKIPTLSTLYLNKYISNFGTDWIRPLLMIFIFGFFASFFYIVFSNTPSILNSSTDILLWTSGGFIISILIYLLYHFKEWKLFTLAIISYISLIYFSQDVRIITNDISKLINPLNIFKGKDYFEDIATYGMFVKLVTATLIYQFIMAFRQNTRRK